VLPTLVALGCAAGLAWHEGGSFAPGSWLPYSLLLAVVAAVVLLAGAVAVPARAVVAGVGGLVGLAVWDAVSLLWAPSPALARDEALLTLTYALAFGLAALTLRTESARLAALAAAVVVGAGIAVAAAAVLVWGAGQEGRFFAGRLAFPISYVNASGAVFAAAFWPALALAARRAAAAPLRALALGAAGAALATCLMTQSKGSLLGLGAASVLVLAVSPLRLRLVAPLALAVLPPALAFGRLTEPFRADGADAIRRAGGAALVVTALCALLGLAYALVDRRLSVDRGTERQAGFVLLIALVAVLAGGGAAFVVRVDDPGGWIAARWHSAASMSNTRDDASSHLGQLGSNRVDFWRVAAGEFARHPLAGDGARGFGPAYLLHGTSAETPRRAHSLPLDVLAETGIVGLLLLVAGLGVPLVAACRRLRGTDVVAVGAVGGFAAWLVQSGVDWTWTIPGDTLLALVLLGVALARGGEAVRPAVARGTAAAALVVAALALLPPWLAARYTQRGIADRSTADLARAHRLDPLSTEPLVAELYVRPAGEALPSLEAAVRREPRMVVTRYALANAYLAVGRTADAHRELLVALRLKPGDPGLERLVERTR
jgi:hypothetical protein